MLGQHGQIVAKMGRHGDRTKAAVSAWLSEDFSVGTYTRHQIEEQVLHYAKMRNTDDGIDFSGGLRSLAPIIRSLIGERLEKSGDVWIIKPVRVPRGSLGKDEAKMVLKRHLTVMDHRTAASKEAQIERLERNNWQLLAQLEKEQREKAAFEAALMEPSLWGESLGIKRSGGGTAGGSAQSWSAAPPARGGCSVLE